MKINLSDYGILIERGLIKNCGETIRSVTRGKRCVVVTDSNVAQIYCETVTNQLNKQGIDTSVFIFPAGEKSKKIDTVLQIIDFAVEQGLSRDDFFVALGGGVVGDLTGFASAIYLRGIDFIGIPTSLLAQIDSSVGGKTGCDLERGKNLVGAFHNPKAVIIDPDTLDTLPKEFMTDGMGEAIKYGCIKSAGLFERLEKEEKYSFLDQMIFECVSIKAEVVEQDFKESGERALLNFGHTLGHAIEKIENYCGISHGMAVSIGMCLVTKACERQGLCSEGTFKRLVSLCEKYDLPTKTDYSVKDICTNAGSDKKREADFIKLITLKEIGKADINKIYLSDLENFIGE